MESTTNQPQKVYKTPEYTRKAVKAYVNRQKENNPDLFKQRRKEADRRYYEKKNKKDDNSEFKKNDNLENNSS